MTNFEKFKKELTIEDVCRIFDESYSCEYCPATTSCEIDDNVSCEELLKRYLEQESESE